MLLEAHDVEKGFSTEVTRKRILYLDEFLAVQALDRVAKVLTNSFLLTHHASMAKGQSSFACCWDVFCMYIERGIKERIEIFIVVLLWTC